VIPDKLQGLGFTSVDGFEKQQPSFDRQPSSETRQGAVRADDPVTGNDDRDGIPTIGCAHGPTRVRSANLPRQLAVRHGLAVRNRRQGGPHLPLERRALGRERKLEAAQPSGEVGIELDDDVSKGPPGPSPPFGGFGRTDGVLKRDPAQAMFVADE